MMTFTAVMVPALGLAGSSPSRSQAEHPATAKRQEAAMTSANISNDDKTE